MIYLLKDRGTIIKEDYYGITGSILSMLEDKEASQVNVKSILREVSKAVSFVELNFKNEDNEIKQEKALEMARNSILELNLSTEIPDESIIYIIRLSTALLPGPDLWEEVRGKK
ncbi:hypothetical protein [Clostridium sp. JN-9]|uniref:hypothetical protein n=1 Tax=Clostridium sp. JN-9 TaxID=2507159 RepID=UPI001FA9AA7A|nr:hypothetical protein [Clostridium sp. JN-9]